jgi:HSP20 family protein
MAEVQVRKEQKEQSVARRQPTDFFAPMFPFERSFGLSPFDWIREFRREMDRAFRGLTPSMEAEAWAPAIDVQQCNGALTLTAELPGLKKDEVKVEVTDDALIIEGERKQEHKEDHEGYHRWERSYGHFYRSIPLPEGAKTDQVKAELSDGILKVSLPVPEVKKHIRQIAVEEVAKAKPSAA